MSWKEFFKPTWKKIILFLIISSILYASLSFYNPSFLYSIHYFYLITYGINYLLSCLLIFFWNKLRKREERETNLYEWGMFFGVILVALLRILIVLFNKQTLFYQLFSPFYRISIFFDSYFYLTPIIAGLVYGLIISLIYWIFTSKKEKEVIARRFWKAGLILVIIIILIISMVLLFKLYSRSIGCDYKEGEYEIRIYDSNGNVTGMINGEVKTEIPDSFYHTGYKVEVGPNLFNVFSQKINIFNPKGPYVHELFGVKQGNYNFAESHSKKPEIQAQTITISPKTIFVEEGEEVDFNAKNIPLSPRVTHRYSFNWDALAEGKEGATILIDKNNDRVFETSITSDNELTCKEFLLKTGKSSYSKILGIGIIFITICVIIIVIALMLIIYTIKYKTSKAKKE